MVTVPRNPSEPVLPRFDWYAATINASPDSLRSVLCSNLAATAAPVDGARHGFHNREHLTDEAGRTVAVLLHGGNGDIPHAFASSDHAPAFADVVRHHYDGRHRVSRFDAALDFDNGPGTWDRLYALCGDLADGVRVDGDNRRRVGKITTNQIGNWRHAPYSRTFYLGAFKSAVLVRLYEKGRKLIQEAEVRGLARPDCTDDLVRLEVQVRPDGDSKRRASRSTPAEAFGYSEWSRELLRRVDGSDVERVHVKERRDSDLDRALQWMVHQYGNHLLQEVQNVGGWHNLGEALRRRLELGSGQADDATPF